MSGLDELRQRVEAAEGHFGMIAAQSETYSTRLTGLMTRMEQAHADQQREIAALSGQIGRAEAENRELRGMLLGLLQAIETGDGSGVDGVVRDLERRIDTMVGKAVAGAAAIEAPEAGAMDVADDHADIMLDDEGDPAGAPADEASGDELLVDELPADEAPADDALADEAFGEATEVVEASDAALIDEPAADLEVADAEAAELIEAFAEVDVEEAAAETDDDDGAEAGIDSGQAHEAGGEADDDMDALVAAVLEDAAGAEDPAESAARDQKPVPETVALDDTGERQESGSSSPADELLSRVDAVANALMAGGIDMDPDDDELTGEISALLQDAIGAKRAQLQAEAEAVDTGDDEADISIDDWAETGDDVEQEIAFEEDAAA